MATTNTKSRLSRKYVYAPLTDLSVDLETATLNKVALLTDPAVEPSDADPDDWIDGIVVTQTGANSSLWVEEIGDAIAILVGPERGDATGSTDLASGEYMMWSDWKVPGSDERHVEWHGKVTIVTAPGSF